MAMASASSVSASRSIVTLPSASAVVPRMMADVDRQGLVEQVFLAAERHQLDQIFGGHGVDLAAAVARVDEGAQADRGDDARLAGGDVAKQVADDALRQVVGLDLVVDRQLAAAWAPAPSGRR